MFDKKYKKTLEILNSEIELNRCLFYDYSTYAEVVKDEKTKAQYMIKANEYIKKYKILSELKERLYKEIES